MKAKITNKLSTLVTPFLVLILFGATIIKASPGDLDQTFGQGGRVFTNVAVPGYQFFYPMTESMLVQPDGKILVCGRFWEDGVSYWYGTYIVRYMPDGTLDSSFGENGKVAVIGPGYPNGNLAVGVDMALQSDGKIVLIGQYTISGGIIVQRYTSAGVLDATFGNNGTTVVTGIAYEEGTSITLQADGKVVGVGWEYDHSNLPTSYYDAILVFRLNTTGSLDNSFGSAGTGVVRIVDGYDGAEVLAQPDGKILVVGTLDNFINIPPTILLARYNPNGSLDSSFGTGGKVTHRINDINSSSSGAALQPDGKIVVVGSTYSTSEFRSFFVRYNPNGSLDTSFASNGVFSVESEFFWPNTVLLQADGSIVATGNAYDGPTVAQDGFAIVRLISNGSLDLSFGSGGRSVFPTNAGGTNYAYASNGAMQPDGKILVTGFFANYYTDSHEKIALIRVDGGRRLTRFDYDGDGKSDISTFRPSNGGWYLNRSTQGFSATLFGLSTDKITPADFDGDGKTDIAVFRDGVWYLLRSSAGFEAVQFGLPGDIPQPADFNGDGKAELAVYRSGTWYTLNLANNQVNTVQFGISNDKPVVGDYDGDGRSDYAVYRDGTWYLLRSTQGFTSIQFGLSTDKLVPADYDGDGKTDQAVYRDGSWYLLGSQTGLITFQFGLASDIPVPADYDGDDRTDAAVYRDGTWHLMQTTAGTSSVQFGMANDLPIPSAYVP